MDCGQTHQAELINDQFTNQKLSFAPPHRWQDFKCRNKVATEFDEMYNLKRV